MTAWDELQARRNQHIEQIALCVCVVVYRYQRECLHHFHWEERTMIIRAHKNLGHPSPERLSTWLRNQGFRSEVAQAALELRCSVCQSQAQPKLAKPSTIRDELDFNDRVCVDGLDWTNKHGTNFHMYQCC